eukprot:8937357-Pyramimonas_sp.AAC.1
MPTGFADFLQIVLSNLFLNRHPALQGDASTPNRPSIADMGPDGPTLPRKVRTHHQRPIADPSATSRRFQ